MSKQLTPYLLVQGGLQGGWLLGAESSSFGLASSCCLSSCFSEDSPINPTKCLTMGS